MMADGAALRCYPDTLETRLGFDVVREALRAHARSALGAEAVAQLRPLRDLAAVRAELARVEELQQALRFDDPVPLEHLIDLRPWLAQAAPEGARLEGEALEAVRRVLVTIRLLARYFQERRQKYPALAALAERLTPLPELERQLAAVVDEEGQVRDDASPELRRLRRRLAQQRQRLRETLLEALQEAIRQGYATEAQPTLRNGRMVIPVRAEARRKVPGFVHDTSASGQTVYIEPASCLELNNAVRELELAEQREIDRILREATGWLRPHLSALEASLDVLGHFDLLQAKVHLAELLEAHVPEVANDGIIDLKGARNPVLVLHFRRLRETTGQVREVVPLDLSLGRTYRTLIITGPNAGGKTVAMKTVGLLVLMLACGLPIPADPASHVSLFDQLLIDIGDEQSVEADLSTFSAHMTHMAYMLAHADERTLVLIDEAGTGTDPDEGAALAQAILETLTRRGARTIATTHHGALKVFAYETEGVENGSMQFDQTTLRPTYRFQPGVPGSSYAFEIARRMGIPEPVLVRAQTLVGRQQVALEALVRTLEQRTQELETRLAVLAEEQARLERLQREYREQRERLETETEAIRQRALEEAEQLLQEANARIERTIREIKEAQAEREATRAAREALERFRRRVREQRRKARPQPSGSEEPRPTLAVGDQVVLDEGGTPAEVLALKDDEALIAVGSLKMRVPVSRLRRLNRTARRAHQRAAASTSLPALQARTRIDVRGYRVDEALQAVERLIDEAVAGGLREVEVLHGKGTGALRQAIRTYLQGRSDVARFEDAPWEQGGPGVTRIWLK
ncbi:endonuclease MutS2 [Rhodothermus profundi]|uniref:Endonuclease MutS2 n=1 Tax=Rhodothermus profundi TaxID=633813 RepID=A0A1M6RYV8_9BACT|nr:endonuclease MutS2 [Rhodothermus profundi]SHK37641.1 DNA mismatch repair protein MutS2 [Rhodothermus profundi]